MNVSVTTVSPLLSPFSLYCKIIRRTAPHICNGQFLLKDTHREKSTLKLNSSAYEKYEYGHIYVVSTYKLFLRGSKTGTNVVTGKTPLFVIGPFCSGHFICLNIGF